MRQTRDLFVVAGIVAVAGVVGWQWSLRPSSAPVDLLAAPAPPAADAAMETPSAEAPAVEAPPPVSDAPAVAETTRKRSARRGAPRPRDAAKATVAEAAPPAPSVEAAVPRLTYEQRLADAAGLADEREALAMLQQLAIDEPGRPDAYEAMAGISLRNHHYDQARAALGSALAHGGKATFALIHDHNRGNFEKENPEATCVGELIIAGSEVRFSSQDRDDGFVATWAEVRGTGSNRFFGSGIGGFHVTLTQNGKYKNFNLAPRSRDKAEGKLILELLEASARQADREQ